MSTQPQNRLRPFQPVSFGPYTLVSPLAAGGMGELFLARRDESGTPCVIKKILPHLASGPDLVQRFVHEAKALAQLSHESIARVLDMGIEEERPYLVLEYVDGKDLRKVAARGLERHNRLPPALIVYVMTRVLDALAYAHDTRDEEGNEIHLVHRDVSPPNILISYKGEVKVVDFGLAKSTLHSAKTHPSLLLGKFLYMSPEQARHLPVDRRSDLYSVGVCLYELLLGANPFEGLSPAELMAEVARPTFLSKRPLSSDLPLRLTAAVARALDVDPRVRFPNATVFRAELLGCLQEMDPAVGPHSLARWMQQAFATEFVAERRLLQAAKGRVRPSEGETAIHQLESYPTPEASALSAAPATALSANETLEGVEPLSFEPVHRTRAPTEQGMIADAPTSPGDQVMEGNTQPEVTSVGDSEDARPTPAAVPIPELHERRLRLASSPQRSVMWLFAPALVALLALGGYLLWDLQRSGFFRGSVPFVSAAAPEEEDDTLAPITPLTGERPGQLRSTLAVSWGKLQTHFDHFRYSRGCTAGRRATLCRRHDDLAREVNEALARGESGHDELLGRIRELDRALDEER